MSRASLSPILFSMLLLVGGVHAATVVDGLTFSYNFDFQDWSCETTPGVAGCKTGSATAGFIDVQRYFGHSEFDLAGLQPGTATLTFTLAGQSASEGTNTSLLPKASTFSLGAYAGDNQPLHPPNSFFAPPPPNEFGTQFATFSSGADAEGRSLLKVGDTFSFDVTAPLATALGRGDAALGVGLVSSLPASTGIASSLYSFANFRLTVDAPVAAIPEPGIYALMLGGLAALGAWRRRAHREAP